MGSGDYSDDYYMDNFINYREVNKLIVNEWVKVVERLEGENAELKEKLKEIQEIMLMPDEDVEYPDLRTLVKIERVLRR